MKRITVTLFLFAAMAVAQTGSTGANSTTRTKASNISAVRDAYMTAYNAKQADKSPPSMLPMQWWWCPTPLSTDVMPFAHGFRKTSTMASPTCIS
jgi:hypothetical protein